MAKNVQLLTQDGNACGTTTLAMIINAFRGNRELTQEDIDEQIRNLDIFAAPVSVAQLAEEYNLNAQLCNETNFQLINTMVRDSNVCQLIVDAPELSNGRNLDAKLHYIVVDWAWEGERQEFEPGMRAGEFFNYLPTDRGKWVRVKDPHGEAYILKYEDLKVNYWERIYFKGVSTGLSNFMIVYSSEDLNITGYSTFHASAALAVTTNTSELVNALVRTGNLELGAFPVVIKNALETILSAAAAIIKTPGAMLDSVSREGLDAGLRLLKDDPNVLEGAAGVLITGVSAPIWVASQPIKWVGDGIGALISIFD